MSSRAASRRWLNVHFHTIYDGSVSWRIGQCQLTCRAVPAVVNDKVLHKGCNSPPIKGEITSPHTEVLQAEWREGKRSARTASPHHRPPARCGGKYAEIFKYHAFHLTSKSCHKSWEVSFFTEGGPRIVNTLNYTDHLTASPPLSPSPSSPAVHSVTVAGYIDFLLFINRRLVKTCKPITRRMTP